jgi:PAS domain S-box-containing protein
MEPHNDRDGVMSAIIEGTTDAVFVKDLDGRYLLVNSSCARFIGRPPSEIVGRLDTDLYPPDTARQFMEADREVLATGETRVFEGVADSRGGAHANYRVTKGVVRDAAGRTVGLFGISHDLTDLRAAEEERERRIREQAARHEAEATTRAKDELLGALRASEERYRAFIANSSEGIWRVELEEPIPVGQLDADEQIERFCRHGYIAECNDAMARMYGFARAEELHGARVGDLLIRDEPENVEHLRALVASNYALSDAETVEVDREGRPRFFVNSLHGAFEGGRLVRVWGTQRDVTERRAAERKLRALVDASQTLLGSPHTEAVLRAVVSLAARLVSADAYAVWRYRASGAGARWEVVSAEGLSDEYRDSWIAVNEDTPSMPDTPVVVEDVDSLPLVAERRDLYRCEGIRSLLALPLRIHGAVGGSLVFYHRERRSFPEPDVEVAAAIANLSASAIGTAELYEEQSRLRREAEAASRRANFLSEAAAVLTSSLEYERTLEAVARLAVPHVADWCAVDIVGDDGGLRRLAVAHVDPAKVEWARALAERYPHDPEAPQGVAHVLRTARPELYPHIPDEMLVAAAKDDEHLRVLRETGFVSAMLVPMSAHGRTSGVITFVTAESGRHYDSEDLAFAEHLARRAALAVENARLYREAQEANHIKDEFLATLSHELRTPLTAILGWASMLRSGRFDEAATQRALETIERNARAQRQIVEDVLDVSRIITGRLRIDARPVEVRSLVEAAVDGVRPAAEAKGVFLSTMLGRDVGVISADPDRLQQVMWNLLSNAVKFTPQGGRVEVELRRDGDHASVRVADTGQGVAREFLPHVFERFRQADSSTTRQHGGLGLGLAIVRHLVELHGGTVRAESEGEGKGATFTVELPTLRTPDVGLRVKEETNAVVKFAPAAEVESADDEAAILDGVNVLLVEDDEDARLMLRNLLEGRGACVTAAASSREAWAALELKSYDVLVSDIGMPVEDGYALVRRLREREAGRGGGRLPAVALTAYARDEDRTRALRSGFHAHVPKPVNPAELVAVVASLAGLSPSGRREVT